MEDEITLRMSLHGMSKALPQPQWLSVCWAINEIDALRPDAAKWRAAVRTAEELKVVDMDAAKAALLSLSQQVQKVTRERDELAEKIEHMRFVAEGIKKVMAEKGLVWG